MQWDFVLFNMLFNRLETDTATRFEMEYASKLEDNKYFETLQTFLAKQALALDTVAYSSIDSNPKKTDTSKQKFIHQTSMKMPTKSTLVANSNSKLYCQICKKDHLIYNCPTFLTMSPKDRFSMIRNNGWCTNFLGFKHSTLACISRSVCKKCLRRHHTLLHFDSDVTTSTSIPPSVSQKDHIDTHTPSQDSSRTALVSNTSKTVLLSTAVVEVKDSWGSYQQVRILLDSGSQSNFISSKCCKRLGLKCFPSSMEISGIGNTSTRA